MGRIKGLFCSCLNNGADYSSGETTFDRNLDVSHLATPHITPTIDQSVGQDGACENSADDKYSSNYDHSQQRQQQPQQQQEQQQSQQHHSNNIQSDLDEQHIGEAPAVPLVRPSSSLNHETASSSQPSSSSPFAPSPINLYEPPQHESHHHDPVLPESHLQQNSHPPLNNVVQPPPPLPPPPIVAHNSPPSTSNGTATKLSYDIISVREPLAKILAERQQLLQYQQQQRQILGDHEYIEVYGERGSSCFYEEIAGSVTSSATYDQIGAASNHNYQVLINAYAVANRQSAANVLEGIDPNAHHSASDPNNNQQEENTYDVTSHQADQTDGPSTSNTSTTGPNSCAAVIAAPPERTSPNLDGTQLTQSIPVYSVINKATRRSSSLMRAAFENSRPPEPPPKNLFMAQHQQPSTSAMNTYNEPSISAHQLSNGSNSNVSRARSPVAQIPSTSSYFEANRPSQELGETPSGKHRNTRLPQPPPRYSKQPAFNHTTDRPLPLPKKSDSTTNNNSNSQTLDQSLMDREEDDIESLNNGYELLRSNLDDDQIDVGYEKIRESNRYSGGSISSQFYSRQLIDNGGYESVQPIYSSPSNCYEVLNPATASEIAAAAAAKLNVLEKFLKKDQ